MKARFLLACCVTALAACAPEAVKWSGVVRAGGPREPSEFPGAQRPRVDGCPASLRVTTVEASSFAAWWRARTDSSAELLVARSTPRGKWTTPVVADSTDRSTRGCFRPPPSIAADPRSGYVHVAYFAEPAGGPGVFFAHSMDSAQTFHAAVPIIFGRNASRVSVDSEGDRVAVAFEDPNSEQPVIGIALSRSMGHLFEKRVRATSPNGRARQPVLRLSTDSIRLWWSEYSPNPAVSATRAMYRAGKW